MIEREHYFRKAEELLRSALSASDGAERARLINETVRMHRLAIDVELEERHRAAAATRTASPAARK